jgi:hypothetical protein
MTDKQQDADDREDKARLFHMIERWVEATGRLSPDAVTYTQDEARFWHMKADAILTEVHRLHDQIESIMLLRDRYVEVEAERDEMRRLLHAMPNVILALQQARDHLDQTSGQKELSSVGPLGTVLRIDEALADIRHAKITATLSEGSDK